MTLGTYGEYPWALNAYGLAFFSDKNTEFINTEIQNRVATITGHVIGPQSNRNIKLYMFNEFGLFGNIAFKTDQLNKEWVNRMTTNVIEKCVDAVLIQIQTMERDVKFRSTRNPSDFNWTSNFDRPDSGRLNKLN
jgi:hypothetical protein